MGSLQVLLTVWCISLGTLVFCADGPVFNIAAQQVVATPVVKPQNYVTQTVYGFLDFTTTIADTVMIFSPNSAAPKPPVTEKAKDITSNSIIDTKPAAEASVEVKKEVKITPSKPQATNKKTVVNENLSKDIKTETKVNIKADSIPKKAVSDNKKAAHKVQVKSEETKKITVVENKPAPDKLKPKPSAPIIISKVEVIEETPKLPQIVTKVEVVTEEAKTAEPILATKIEKKVEPSVAIHSVVQVKSDDEPARVIGNNIGEPEYDFLSRQPSEFVEETYKLVNLRPSSRLNLKPRASIEAKPIKRPDASAHPTGLVSKIEGMMVKDGVMTSYETSVIGTYINGKYAQVLQSTSQVFNQPQPKGYNIKPSPSVRILKTAAPVVNKLQNHYRELDPTPIQYDGNTMVENFQAPQSTGKVGKKTGKRFKNRSKEQLGESSNEIRDGAINQSVSSFRKSGSKNRPSQRSSKTTSSSKRNQKSGRGSTRKHQNTTPSQYSEDLPTPPPSSTRRSYHNGNGNRKKSGSSIKAVNSPEQAQNQAGFSRRGYKPKVQTSVVESNAASTSLYKFKLNRSPGRWQYKTTPRPRVTIRKQNDDSPNLNETLEPTSPATPNSGNINNIEAQINNEIATSQSRSDDVDSLEGSESIATIIDDDGETNNKLDAHVLPLETIKVEISTPPDFSDVYYEIATIKSPYTFKVGNVQNTRFITVTSTFEKTISDTPEPTPTAALTEPLTENILATTTNFGKDNNFLDSSIATLPPIYLASDQETPPLETLTETFSTTQSMLKTHLLPIVKGINETMTSTLVQTYLITRLVTATKTLPPMEAYQFIPSKALKEFNSHLDEAGSELHLELEFGDQNDEDGGERSPSKILPEDLDLSKVGLDFSLPDTDKSKLEQEALKIKKQKAKEATTPAPPNPNLNPQLQQQLALLGLLNPAAQQGQVITTSKPVLKVETLYETHVLPVTQGQNTVLSTISKVKGTFTKTDYEFGTSTIAPALPPVPQVPPYPNPLFPQPQIPQIPQFTVTSSPVVQSTMVTQTNSKVLKLTFGARTAQTTVFSTTVVPSIVTSYVTASVPVQATAFPGFFPAPYPPFGYVG